jgi:hypothetical protein
MVTMAGGVEVGATVGLAAGCEGARIVRGGTVTVGGGVAVRAWQPARSVEKRRQVH